MKIKNKTQKENQFSSKARCIIPGISPETDLNITAVCFEKIKHVELPHTLDKLYLLYTFLIFRTHCLDMLIYIKKMCETREKEENEN